MQVVIAAMVHILGLEGKCRLIAGHVESFVGARHIWR